MLIKRDGIDLLTPECVEEVLKWIHVQDSYFSILTFSRRQIIIRKCWAERVLFDFMSYYINPWQPGAAYL